MTDTTIERHDVELADGLRLHYRTAGDPDAPPVLLLHGWPTSSHLYLNVMPALAAEHRPIALDLPGFGASDKPLDASYSFRFFDRALGGFLDAIEVDRLGLVVHDLGGPVGLHWAVGNPDRVDAIGLLNTLVYPRPSAAVVAFVAASYVPGVREWLASPAGLRFAIRFGLHDETHATAELLDAVCAPFAERDARRVLLKAAHSLHPGGFRTIARELPRMGKPIRIVYADRDRILPDVHRTMARVARECDDVHTTVISRAGHFLHYEVGEEVGELLATFFARHLAA